MTKAKDLTSGTVNVSENEATGQKYLLIAVPDFATDPCGDPAPLAQTTEQNKGRNGLGMSTYLRLGAPDSSATPQPGDDLLQHLFDACPAGFTGKVKVGADEKDTVFIDDERNRGLGLDNPAGSVGHGLTNQQRYEWHTQHLKSRGGWRDHSDGNRISTTYGDKVEVIRGNYKLIVMGRQDDPASSTGVEMSGNHIQDFGQATMPGASVTVEWIQDAYLPAAATPDYQGGVWLLINSTERVYQYSRNAGSFREQQWGDRMESYVGSENPERVGTTDDAGYQGHPTADEIKASHGVLDKDDLASKLRPSSKGLPRGNPHIIDKTWASKIEEYTGSANKRVPSIHSETWAEDVVELTDILHGIASNTRIGGGVAEATSIGGAQVSQTTIGGALVDSTIVGAGVVELAIAGTHTAVTLNGINTEVTLCPLTTEVMIGAKSSSISIVGNTSEIAMGTGVSVQMGGTTELHMGQALSCHIGMADDTHIGNTWEVNIGNTMSYVLGNSEEVKTQATVTAMKKMSIAMIEKKTGMKIELG
ncbi:MAG: hypothetical protein JNL21_08645 [Myxococcales bacterium]|nr:hypothetical protein [Myxococcales bacterium]